MSEWWRQRVPRTKCSKLLDGVPCGEAASYSAWAEEASHRCGCVASGKPRCTGHGLCASHAAWARMEGKVQRIESSVSTSDRKRP